MPSPFPGMDPYLENPGWWPDFHHSFITYVRDALQPDIRPRYRARIGERIYLVEPPRHFYPDIALIGEGREAPLTQGGHAGGGGMAVAEADPAVVITLSMEEIRQGFIEILHADGTVITVIELLSPINKASPRGLNDYQQKQQQLLDSTVHLVEIDLLRRGTHAVSVPSELVAEQCAAWDYLVCVRRAPARYRFEVYPITVRARLPRIRVPLRSPDPDIVLDLQAVLTHCYESGGYDDFVDYRNEPPAPLAPDDAAWADALLRSAGRRMES